MTPTILYIGNRDAGSEPYNLLSQTEYNVIQAESLAAAHKHAKSTSFDCIVLDNRYSAEVSIRELIPLLNSISPVPVILLDDTHSIEIPGTSLSYTIVGPDNLSTLPDKVKTIIDQQRIEKALSNHDALKNSILTIVQESTRAKHKEELHSLLFEHLQDTNLFEYVWIGSVNEATNGIKIEYPSRGNFTIDTVTDILQIGNEDIFMDALEDSEIKSTSASVITRESVSASPTSHEKMYELRCGIVPIASFQNPGDVLILATYRTGSFDAAEQRILTKLQKIITHVKSSFEHDDETDVAHDEIDKFVSTLVHELRSPLGVAQAYLDIGRNEGENSDDAFEKVSNALAALEHTIDNMASLARTSSAESEETDLETLATSVWETIDHKEAMLEIDGPIRILGDPDLLEILFRNLLTNAVQHGGKDCTVRIGQLGDGFFVEDSGKGIPEEIQGEIFRRGFSDHDGLGVGLPLVKDIVDAHEWEIEINSEVGEGTRIEIRNVEYIDRGAE